MFHLSSKVVVVALAAIMAVSAAGVNHAFGADPSSDKTIMAFGDSLVAGYGLKPEESFPSQLESKLKADGQAVTAVNAGVSGDTTADGLNRLDWNLSRAKPGYAVLIIGGNDMLRGIDPAVTRQNLDKIMGIFQAHKVPVLIAGMKAFTNLGPQFSAAYADMYKDLAKTYDAVYYPFYLDGVAMKPGLNQDDGIHPNAAGVAIIVDKIMPSVKELLKRAPAS